MKTLGILVAILFASATYGLPWEPIARTESWWMDRHRQFLDSNARLGDQIKIVFLGSSLMEYWGTEGKPVWDANYAGLGAINYGISGDKTENVLWRIANGELDGINPKLVVVYIGSNNVPVVPSNDDVVRGVNEVVTKVHQKLPNANILLVGTFPRADQSNVPNILGRIRAIDDKLIALVQNDQSRRGHFLDIFFQLCPITMDRINEYLYVGDKLHLNRDGYELWAREMNPILRQLIQ